MTVVTLRGKEIHTELDFHRALAGPLEFGPYYGYNLAALRDRLSADVERPVRITWLDSEASRDHLGTKLFESIVEILDGVQAQDLDWGLAERFEYELK